MPKGKNKERKNIAGNKQRGNETVINHGHQDDIEDPQDDASQVSSVSDIQSIVAEGSEDDEVKTGSHDELEDMLKDCLEGALQKNAKGRVECLKRLTSALSKHYLYDFVSDRKLTMNDTFMRSLKKGKGDEQELSAMAVVLLFIQLGEDVAREDLYKEIQPVFEAILTDDSSSLQARNAGSEALGMCSFLASSDWEQVVNMMKTFESIFKASYLKGDHSAPVHSPELTALHTSALSSWSLLISAVPDHFVPVFISSYLNKLPGLLMSNDVELRIVAGETIALLYELAREQNEDFSGDNEDALCEVLKNLATDSNKYRAKKDRRHQRCSFRDVLHTVEDAEIPNYSLKFNCELLKIDSWAKKRQYDSLCHILGSGMNVHLQENTMIRQVFGLGEPLLTNNISSHKLTKEERHHFNEVASKVRTKMRGKVRDKRAATLHDDS